MIKANELRIGSCFCPYSSGGGILMPATLVVYKVMGVNTFSLQAVRLGEIPAQVEKWKVFEYSEISPIPLTPELLNKLGFFRTDEHMFYKDGFGFTARAEIEYFFEWKKLKSGIKGTSFKYLHELQNLIFALGYNELEVQL